MKLNELAFKTGTDFKVSQEQWDKTIASFQTLKDLKRINTNKILKESNGTFSLWVDNECAAFAKTTAIVIPNVTDKTLSVDLVLSNPTMQGKNYGLELLWEIQLAIEDNLYIGGAVFNAGEKLIDRFIAKLQSARSDITVIDKKTGDRQKYSKDAFLKRTSYGILIEGNTFIEAQIGLGHITEWLNDHVNFGE